MIINYKLDLSWVSKIILVLYFWRLILTQFFRLLVVRKPILLKEFLNLFKSFRALRFLALNITFLFATSLSISSQEIDISKGKSLFNANCASCHKLNKKFKRKDKSTDILSFPFYKNFLLKEIIKKGNKDIYLGVIIINLSKVRKEKFLIKEEFNKLWIHGLLHLLGYKHTKNKDYATMLKLENKFLKVIQ